MESTASVKVSTAFSEVLDNLIRELRLAIQWNRPSLLVAIYKTESVRINAENALEQAFLNISQHIERLQITEAQPNFLQIMQQIAKPGRVIFSISGLRNGGGQDGKDAYRTLNLYREVFVEQRYRVVFWLTETEAKNLPRFAPDFWAFRHRVVEFASDRTRSQNALPSGALLWHVENPDSLPQTVQEDIQYLKQNLASLPKANEAIAMRLEILYKLAYLEWLRGKPESAAVYLSTGNDLANQLRITQVKGLFLNAQGIIAYETNDKRAALSQFIKAVEANPRDGLPVVNAAITYQALGQRKNAIEASKRAVKLDPRNPRIWNALGHLYLSGGQIESACSSFEHAISLERRHPIYHLGLAVCQFKAGESEKAIHTLIPIEEADRFLSNYYLACKKIFQGKTDDAIRIVKSTLVKNDILFSWLCHDPVLQHILGADVIKSLI